MEEIQNEFNASQVDGKQVSLADMIVLGGCAGVEQGAKNAGYVVIVPFTAGRTDATKEQTDTESFAVLEPIADGFRNYQRKRYTASSEELLIDKAQLLTLSAPEMTVLVGGMRVLGTNYDGSQHGVFTENVGSLSNDFFINILDLRTKWSSANEAQDVFEGRDRTNGQVKWTGKIGRASCRERVLMPV